MSDRLMDCERQQTHSYLQSYFSCLLLQLPQEFT